MSVELEMHDGVATVSLNRPEKLNALTDEMYVQLIDIFAGLAADDAVRAVVVTGKGRGFCSGSDFGGMLKSDIVENR
jgi:enoyl-CoA hydratase/carnithine racemase